MAQEIWDKATFAEMKKKFVSALNAYEVAKTNAELMKTKDTKTVKEELARKIMDISVSFGVNSMSPFAALSIAEELLKEQEKAENPPVKFYEAELLGDEEEPVEVPADGLITFDHVPTTNLAAESEIHTKVFKVIALLTVTAEKPLAQWEPEARALLQQEAAKKDMVLISRAHLVGVSDSWKGILSVMGFAIPVADHYAKKGFTQKISNWKKHGLTVTIGKATPPPPHE